MNMNMNVTKKRLFVIDDEKLTTDFVCTVGEHNGYITSGINDAGDIPVDLCKLSSQDILIIDLLMPRVDGIKLLGQLAEGNCGANIILMSGQGTRLLEKTMSLGIKNGLNITGILPKPFYFKDVLKAFDEIETTSSKTAATRKFAGQANHNQRFNMNDIRAALEGHEFVPYFQPKVTLDDNRICGFEVLARWESPTHGVIPPLQFIDLIESDPICLDFTIDIIRQALTVLTQKKADSHSLDVSFNIPPIILKDAAFPDIMNDIIGDYDFPRNNIIFEITERSIPDNVNIAVEIINRLALMGYRISIDDFGTGHSSLEKIRDLMIHEIKIDRSFIANLFQQDTRAIIRNAIGLAESLELDIVAEGVENEALLVEARLLGINVAQGYLFGKPVSASQLEQFKSAFAAL